MNRRSWLTFGALIPAFLVRKAEAQVISASTGTTGFVIPAGLVGDYVADNSTPIQNAINTVATAGGGTVVLPPPAVAYGIGSTLTLKPGVTLEGYIGGPGYFDGYDSYTSTANTGDTTRIKALAGLSGSPLITLDVSDTSAAARARGFGIRNLICDGAGITQWVILGNQASYIERVLTLDNCVIMRSGNNDGITTNNMLVFARNCHFYGNARYGGNFAPVVDSSFIGCYCHSNAGGGYNFQDGSTHVTIIGGKVEENSGPGVSVTVLSTGTAQVNLVGVDIQHNTKSGIYCLGGGTGLALAKATGCMLFDNGYAGTLLTAAQVGADSNGRIVCDDTTFGTIDTPGSVYHFGATNSAKVWYRNGVIVNAASTALTYTATSGVITADGGTIASIA